MNTILVKKFNNKALNYSIQEDVHLYNISVYGNHDSMLFYQTYKIVNEYCGDCSFTSIKNEFSDGKLFTNGELKSLFEIENVYPNVDNYYLDNLFNYQKTAF